MLCVRSSEALDHIHREAPERDFRDQAVKEFPELRKTQKKHQLWNPSYFVETIGSTSEENVRKYILSQ